jgi:uncharacterized protein YpmB
MRRKFLKYIFFLLVILVAVIVAIGIGVWNKPHENIKDAVAIKTGAEALYQSLSDKTSQAKSMYVNKVVAVTGKVVRVMKNQQEHQVVFLQSGVNGGSVNCTMEENIENIKEGDTLTLKGICIGYSGEDDEMGLRGDVFLVRCYRS